MDSIAVSSAAHFDGAAELVAAPIALRADLQTVGHGVCALENLARHAAAALEQQPTQVCIMEVGGWWVGGWWVVGQREMRVNSQIFVKSLMPMFHHMFAKRRNVVQMLVSTTRNFISRLILRLM